MGFNWTRRAGDVNNESATPALSAGKARVAVVIVDGSLLLIASTEQSTTSERLDADREILDCLFVRLSVSSVSCVSRGPRCHVDLFRVVKTPSLSCCAVLAASGLAEDLCQVFAT